MSQERKLVGPWRTIHGAVWLIGLAILFWKGWFWPGILVLIGISAIVEAVIRLNVPGAAEPVVEDKGPVAKSVTEPQAPPAAAPVVEGTPSPVHRADLLPSVCPKCNAPVHGNEVKWTGPQSANCAYCGANLPSKSEA